MLCVVPTKSDLSKFISSIFRYGMAEKPIIVTGDSESLNSVVDDLMVEFDTDCPSEDTRFVFYGTDCTLEKNALKVQFCPSPFGERVKGRLPILIVLQEGLDPKDFSNIIAGYVATSHNSVGAAFEKLLESLKE